MCITINDVHPEGGIYRQFVYLLDSGVYPNCLDMNELYEMLCYMKTKTNGRENFNKGE